MGNNYQLEPGAYVHDSSIFRTPNKVVYKILELSYFHDLSYENLCLSFPQNIFPLGVFVIFNNSREHIDLS
jgi:hypothetical protein